MIFQPILRPIRRPLQPGSHDLAVSLALATLPQPLIALLLRRLTASLGKRHPRLADRLAELDGRHILIVPDELPYALLIGFPDGRVGITLVDPADPPASEAQMRGPLRLFYDLVRGGRDGDALFFSRELVVTGDMATAVTLRNALDGAGVDLFAEFIAMRGPAGPLVRGAGALVDRLAGIVIGPVSDRTGRLEAEIARLRTEVRRLKDIKPRAARAAAGDVA
ncbi:ubiquinone anaerobic biosynthesis accessory factor UbiT [Polymorphobacter fuscus]|uniref:SCP2 domain-containing protein n=1 Tax=Sandarakinorhabdus fusca TaxID=1439888 RepID=A0A7C9GTJ9_9SPHN|nr:SCP2 sterol-binding domain-containing protein [Polymorphobacter fuscus]KAB7643726.1 hypothetical protein F9290_15575 [Polymorphobacter fuscus]MQT18671.1 hypothetical protein [Polymorphobacter fuscus]NJC08112.1 putative lipid carrier protein YhbT [Polymorphobacter fuscus]